MDMAFILGTAAPCHTLAKGSRAKDWERGAQTVRRCGVTAQGVLRREPSRDRGKAPKSWSPTVIPDPITVFTSPCGGYSLILILDSFQQGVETNGHRS